VKINRENFLRDLRRIEAGLAIKETVEQSSCFVFKDGEVMTYNSEIACRRPTKLKFEGAVAAKELLMLLDKLTEKVITVEPRDNEFLVSASKGRRQSGISMEKEIELPYAQVETPKKWTPLPEGFLKALDLVHICAGTDESEWQTTCVHIHPKWLEACDNVQLTRHRLKTPVERPVMIRSTAAKHIVTLDMIEFSETTSWMHFRNEEGVILSCRRFVEDDYPDLSEFMQIDGSPIVLPKGVSAAVENASIFLSTKAEGYLVEVIIKPGRFRIKGLGTKGWYKERKELDSYKGEAITFRIPPKLLVEITEKYHEAIISSERIKVQGERFVYITSLNQDDDKDDKDENTESEDEDAEESED
jgi:hypothetical protein